MSSLHDMINQALSSDESNPGAVTHNPYMDMDLDDLVKIAAAEGGASASTGPREVTVLDPADLDALGGEIMAHSMFQELDFIREKVASGACRVCKEQALDVAGSTICSPCMEDSGE